jgi:hypothetical protein
MLRCTSRSTFVRKRSQVSRRFSSSQGASASSATTGPDASSSLLHVSQVRSRRVWQKLQQRPRLESPKARPKEEEKPWPMNVRYGAMGVASIVIPYSLVWIAVSVPALRTSLLSKAQVEYLRRHFGNPEPQHVAYPEILNSQGVTDPLRIPAVLPGEGSPRQEANAEAIERRLAGTVRVELSVSSSESMGDPQSTICLKLPASERASRDALVRRWEGLASADLANSYVSVSFPDDESDDAKLDGLAFADNFSSDTSEAGDGADAAPALDPLLRRIAIYSTWYYQPNISLDRGSGGKSSSSSSNHPVTSQFTNEELQIRHLEAEVARLRVELQNLHSTRPFDDIRDELAMCQSQLRRLKWKRWVPWWQ